MTANPNWLPERPRRLGELVQVLSKRCLLGHVTRAEMPVIVPSRTSHVPPSIAGILAPVSDRWPAPAANQSLTAGTEFRAFASDHPRRGGYEAPEVPEVSRGWG